jgi:hypothetical protein
MEPKYRHRYLLQKISEYLKQNNNEGNCFIESGVKQGSASVVMSKILKKRGYLFDTWSNFPHFNKIDYTTLKRKQKLQKRVEKGKNTYQECKDNLISNKVYKACKMVRGDILKTVPKFIGKKGENLFISLIHSDSDLYEPTKTTLNLFFPFLTNGGMVLVHDYQTKQWPGVTKSVDEFVKKKHNLLIHIFKENVTCSFLIMKDNHDEYKEDFDFLVQYIDNKFPCKTK